MPTRYDRNSVRLPSICAALSFPSMTDKQLMAVERWHVDITVRLEIHNKQSGLVRVIMTIVMVHDFTISKCKASLPFSCDENVGKATITDGAIGM
uniref:Uncharacterized protein n=1 Tax=Panagrellus redivivus TaxID=6233 RepID=A0A7E4VK12_PANRE